MCVCVYVCMCVCGCVCVIVLNHQKHKVEDEQREGLNLPRDWGGPEHLKGTEIRISVKSKQHDVLQI